jgi:hypothetical protein
MTRKPQFADRRGPVGQEPRLKRGIAPGVGDDRRAALGPDLVAIHFDPGVDRCGIDELLLRKKALQRSRAQRRLGRQMRMEFLMDMGDCL